jgi:hypothetical protein
MSEAFTQKDYYKEVQLLAQEALTREADGEDINDAVHEMCDSHEYVIYSYKALTVLIHSNNDMAFQDVGPLPEENPWGVAAYFAMSQDVQEAINDERPEFEAKSAEGDEAQS